MSDFVIENGDLINYTGKGGDVVIPEGVTKIGSFTFYGCENLRSIVIPEGVTEIGYNAFYGCENLQSFIIPKGVTKIGPLAFSGCHNLRSIVIPESVNEIEIKAFSGCKNLQSVVIPESVNKIGNGAFCGCEKLADENGFAIVRNVLYSYHGNDSNVVIPKHVEKIGKSSFFHCEKLQSIVIPEGITEIESSAFVGCENLQRVVIPNSIIKIGESIFDSCPNILYVYAEKNIINIISNKNMQKTCAVVVTSSENNVSFLAYCSKAKTDNFTNFVKTGKWNAYDIELLNNGPTYKYKPGVRFLGALGRLNDPVDLTDECKELYMELLVKNAKKLIPIAEEIDCPEIVEMMIKHEIINDGNRKAINKLLKASANEKIAAFAE